MTDCKNDWHDNHGIGSRCPACGYLCTHGIAKALEEAIKPARKQQDALQEAQTISWADLNKFIVV